MRSLRKADTHVDVTYQNGGTTDSLIARNFTLDANEKRVLLSMDLSANERTRSKGSNIYLDVNKLIERAAEVESFQVPKEKWLDPLKLALQKHRGASREVEIRFKDSPSHKYQYDLRSNDFDLEFIVSYNGRQAYVVVQTGFNRMSQLTSAYLNAVSL